MRKVVKKAKVSTYELSKQSRIDYSHTQRLLAGESVHPQRATILRLGQALLDLSGELDLDDIDRLLTSAGKAPMRRERVILPKI